jgi:hypothetical protein
VPRGSVLPDEGTEFGALDVHGAAPVRPAGDEPEPVVPVAVGGIGSVGRAISPEVAGPTLPKVLAALADTGVDEVPVPLSAIVDPPQPARPATMTRPAAAAPGFTYLPRLESSRRTRHLPVES